MPKEETLPACPKCNNLNPEVSVMSKTKLRAGVKYYLNCLHCSTRFYAYMTKTNEEWIFSSPGTLGDSKHKKNKKPVSFENFVSENTPISLNESAVLPEVTLIQTSDTSSLVEDKIEPPHLKE